MIDLRAVRTITYATAQPIAAKVIEMFDGGEFDVCTLVLRALPLGDLADSDGAAADSAGIAARRPRTRRPTTTSRTRAKSSRSCCRRR